MKTKFALLTSLSALLSVCATTAVATPFYFSALNATTLSQDVIDERLSMSGPLFDGVTRTHPNGGDPWVELSAFTSKAKRYYEDGSGIKEKSAAGFIGYDHAIGDFRLGLALNTGRGTLKAVNDPEQNPDIKHKWWGTNLYATWTGKKVNVIANVGYLHTYDKYKELDSAKTQVEAINAGIRFETSFMAGPISFVPYYGVRFTHLESNPLGINGTQIVSKTAKLWEIPVGVNAGWEFTCRAGWRTRTMLDLGVVPSFGDRKVEYRFDDSGEQARYVGKMSYRGAFGIETSKGQHGFGLSYKASASAHGRTGQALTANYQFMY